jgi:hypothetical protein
MTKLDCNRQPKVSVQKTLPRELRDARQPVRLGGGIAPFSPVRLGGGVAPFSPVRLGGGFCTFPPRH